jgi:hypothetical protein
VTEGECEEGVDDLDVRRSGRHDVVDLFEIRLRRRAEEGQAVAGGDDDEVELGGGGGAWWGGPTSTSHRTVETKTMRHMMSVLRESARSSL